MLEIHALVDQYIDIIIVPVESLRREVGERVGDRHPVTYKDLDPGLQVVDQECSMSKVLNDEGNIVKDNKGIPVEEEVCIDVMGPAFVKPGSSAALDQDADAVLEEDERNLTILAEALRAAKERKEAIKIFEKLAKITDDGEAFIAMGNLYYLDNEIDKAIDVIEKGLKRGNLKNLSLIHI